MKVARAVQAGNFSGVVSQNDQPKDGRGGTFIHNCSMGYKLPHSFYFICVTACC